MNFIRKYRSLVLRIIDIAIIFAAYYVAQIVVNEQFNMGNEINSMILLTSLLSVLTYQVVLTILRTYRNITRYETGNDYLVYVFGCLISCAIMLILKVVFKINVVAVNTNLIASLIIATTFIGYRVILRGLLIKFFKYKKEHKKIGKYKTVEAKNILIIGAGEAAKEIIKAINLNMKHIYNVVGIIDDTEHKVNYSMSGVKILGNRDIIIDVCKEKKINEIFFSIAKIDGKNKKEILELCQETSAKLRILPSTEELINNKTLLENFKDVEIDDLLGRDPISLDSNNIQTLIKNSTVIVTGGGGSIGSELCRQISSYEPKTLIIYDIYENNLYDIELELKAKYRDIKIVAVVGSVRDKDKLNRIFSKYLPKLVFHAAAHKHVPLMENNPLEAIKNNVLGTKNVVDCADEYGVEKFILVSTDKAVNPTNIMGATKRMCEMIIQTKNKISKTEYAAVRFGNVLGSNGSVIPLFKKQIKAGGPITLTHQDITRFFMTIPEAVGLILQAMTYANGGEIFVLDMGEPVKIYDLARSLIKLSGFKPDVDIDIKITGLRPGEKLYEELLMSEEGLEKTAHKKIFVAEPLELSPEEIDEKVKSLKDLITHKKYNIDEVKEAMKKAVPTFVEPNVMNKEIKNNRDEVVKKKEVYS